MNRVEWCEYSANFGERDSELMVRSYDTLMGNVYEEREGYEWSPYRCITPGKKSFPGIWNWDSAFHAIGVSRWDLELAKESILGFLKFQREDGALADLAWERGGVADNASKPPVFAFAVETVYKRDKDIDFLREVYPKLAKEESFWSEQRSYKGLFFYDADEKEEKWYYQRAKNTSGWDNSPRWDEGIVQYWAVDLNCFMVMYYRSLAFIARELGLCGDSDMWQKKGKTVEELINEKLWDDESACYFDVDRYTLKPLRVKTPACFMPLYIGIASNERADAMRVIAQKDFRDRMPTVAFEHPAYSNDYWRGPTWLNVAYFAAKGLKNYGFDVADRIKENILDMCFGEKGGIYENYDSVTGKGLCCDHFSWSSVFIIEFILNF